MHLSHPLAVASGKIVVDGNDMHSVSRKSVEVCRQNGDQRFALARFHFRDATLMKHDAADKLNTERIHPQNAL